MTGPGALHFLAKGAGSGIGHAKSGSLSHGSFWLLQNSCICACNLVPGCGPFPGGALCIAIRCFCSLFHNLLLHHGIQGSRPAGLKGLTHGFERFKVGIVSVLLACPEKQAHSAKISTTSNAASVMQPRPDCSHGGCYAETLENTCNWHSLDTLQGA